MNRIISTSIVLLVTFAVGFVSCAKKAPSLSDGAAEESFKRWMEKYDPQAELKPSGIYIRFVEKGNLGFIAPKPDTSWLVMNYTLFTLNGIIVETRSSSAARLLGTWHHTTHFVDDFFLYYGSSTKNYNKICEGLRTALQYLRTGDSARIYVPAWLAYKKQMNENKGYSGESGDYLNRPVYFDVRLKEIVDNPVRRELLQVQQYALAQWGQTAKDSIGYGLYMRKILENPDGDSITGDSLAKYFYVQRFMDGQLVKTNVKKIAKMDDYFGLEVTKEWSYDAVFLNAPDFEKAKVDTIKGGVFAKVLLNLQMGEAAEVVSTSRWADGNAGIVANIPQILAFEPMRFKIRALTKKEKSISDSLDLSILE